MSDSKTRYSFISQIKIKCKEIYNYRNFVKSLVIKNLFGRYRYSYLGFAWNFINPLIYIILCYFLMSQMNTGGMEDRWLFLSSAMFAFSILTSAITGGGSLFIGNAGMIKKMYFPKEILALSNALSALIVALFGNIIVFVAIIFSGVGINLVALLYLPLVYLMIFIFYIGCSLLLGSLSVYVRDLQFLLSSMSMVFFVCTPIRSTRDQATGIMATIYDINPLTYFIEPLHDILYFKQCPDVSTLGIELLISLFVLFVGYAIFIKLKHGFVERL